MKKTLATTLVTAAVVLLTATFGFAEYAATGEVVAAFALYTILMAMFTNPVIEAVKAIVS